MALSSPYPSITQTRRAVSATLLRVVEDHRKAVGIRLRDLRKSHNMTQMDAAVAVGVELKTWGDWERGKRDPYDSNWRKIGETFEVDPAVIRGTLPAPLGLGAREDQVEQIETQLTAQTRVLEQITAALADLPAVANGLTALLQQLDVAGRQRNRRAGDAK
jgi:DNA-binding XRE family transcriptional regulator